MNPFAQTSQGLNCPCGHEYSIIRSECVPATRVATIYNNFWITARGMCLAITTSMSASKSERKAHCWRFAVASSAAPAAESFSQLMISLAPAWQRSLPGLSRFPDAARSHQRPVPFLLLAIYRQLRFVSARFASFRPLATSLVKPVADSRSNRYRCAAWSELLALSPKMFAHKVREVAMSCRA
jgi:hypothetical protein